MPGDHLRRIRIRGLMSLRDVSLEPRQVTVVIGPNGAGKSNLLAALRMVSFMRTEALWRFLKSDGPPSSLLHNGPKVTDKLGIELTFQREAGHNSYRAELAYAADESLVFEREEAIWHTDGHAEPAIVSLGQGHRESRLQSAIERGDEAAFAVERCLGGLNFFHFHDTSSRSALRTAAPTFDIEYLRSDGSNLAPYLLALRSSTDRAHQIAWQRINRLVQQIAPAVAELVPREIGNDHVILTWRDDQGLLFGPQRLSDGTLRAIALVTALAQPTAHLPAFISIDEPELGLHPAALGLLAGLIRSASAHAQILLATQSPTLLDHFDPEDIVVCERREGASHFRRLDVDALAHWLDDYRLSELYDQNVLGGRP